MRIMFPDMPETGTGFVKEPELLQPNDVAARLQVSRRYVTEMCRLGQITHLKIGRRIKFRPEAVEEFLKKHEVPIFVQPPKKPPVDPLAMRTGRF